MPPLLLDDDEAVAIAVGLRAAAGASVAGIEDTSLRALAKLEQVLPDRLRRRVNAVHANVVPLRWNGSGPTIDSEALAVLAQACRDREQVRFEYQARGGEETRRLVEPHQLVSAGRRWYLVAWDVRRTDWRTFRVDRLRAPQLAGVRFRQRELPTEDAAAFVQAGITAMSTQLTVVVTVFASAETVRKVTGHWAEVTPIDDGSCRLEMRVESFDWPAMLLGALDARFEVVSPPELTAHLRSVGERFVRFTTSPDA